MPARRWPPGKSFTPNPHLILIIITQSSPNPHLILSQGTKGYYIQPTIFTECTDEMTIVKEEIFGPVMQLMKFKTVDEAVRRANDSKYGLAAGVCSRDIGK